MMIKHKIMSDEKDGLKRENPSKTSSCATQNGSINPNSMVKPANVVDQSDNNEITAHSGGEDNQDLQKDLLELSERFEELLEIDEDTYCIPLFERLLVLCFELHTDLVQYNQLYEQHLKPMLSVSGDEKLEPLREQQHCISQRLQESLSLMENNEHNLFPFIQSDCLEEFHTPRSRQEVLKVLQLCLQIYLNVFLLKKFFCDFRKQLLDRRRCNPGAVNNYHLELDVCIKQLTNKQYDDINGLILKYNEMVDNGPALDEMTLEMIEYVIVLQVKLISVQLENDVRFRTKFIDYLIEETKNFNFSEALDYHLMQTLSQQQRPKTSQNVVDVADSSSAQFAIDAQQQDPGDVPLNNIHQKNESSIIEENDDEEYEEMDEEEEYADQWTLADPRKMLCIICDEKFKSDAKLNRHLNDHFEYFWRRKQSRNKSRNSKRRISHRHANRLSRKLNQKYYMNASSPRSGKRQEFEENDKSLKNSGIVSKKEYLDGKSVRSKSSKTSKVAEISIEYINNGEVHLMDREASEKKTNPCLSIQEDVEKSENPDETNVNHQGCLSKMDFSKYTASLQQRLMDLNLKEEDGLFSFKFMQNFLSEFNKPYNQAKQQAQRLSSQSSTLSASTSTNMTNAGSNSARTADPTDQNGDEDGDQNGGQNDDNGGVGQDDEKPIVVSAMDELQCSPEKPSDHINEYRSNPNQMDPMKSKRKNQVSIGTQYPPATKPNRIKLLRKFENNISGLLAEKGDWKNENVWLTLRNKVRDDFVELISSTERKPSKPTKISVPTPPRSPSLSSSSSSKFNVALLKRRTGTPPRKQQVSPPPPPLPPRPTTMPSFHHQTLQKEPIPFSYMYGTGGAYQRPVVFDLTKPIETIREQVKMNICQHCGRVDSRKRNSCEHRIVLH